MLSRLALRAGALAPVLRQQASNRAAVLVIARPSSSSTLKTIENWDKTNAVYYGPERDTKNFPVVCQPESRPPVRLGFIPDSWFTFFYEKTGVTGPYVFGAGLVATLLSKEIWIVEHGFAQFITFWAAWAYLSIKFGKGLGESLDKMGAEYKAKHWDQPMSDAAAASETSIAEIEKQIWQEDGQKYMYEAKKENVDLQLESIYRQRLADVHNAVKRRLDYQVSVENAKRSYQQTHMVDWIVSNVKKGITPQQEKDSIAKCIGDLKALAAKQAPAM